MLNEAEALGVLSALAQESRLRIVRILVAAMPEGLPAGRLGERVGCAPSTLTFHLRHLEHAGLVRSRRRATQVIYSAAPDVLTGLADYLMRECCGGNPDLCRPGPTPAPAMDAAPASSVCCPLPVKSAVT